MANYPSAMLCHTLNPLDYPELFFINGRKKQESLSFTPSMPSNSALAEFNFLDPENDYETVSITVRRDFVPIWGSSI